VRAILAVPRLRPEVVRIARIAADRTPPVLLLPCVIAVGLVDLRLASRFNIFEVSARVIVWVIFIFDHGSIFLAALCTDKPAR
jgi:hypothetical protein